jgi:hypothetical protein
VQRRSPAATMFFVSTEPLLPDQQWHYSASKLLAGSNDRSLLSTLVEGSRVAS